ncbi:MAG: hypothetical protein WA869_22810 [Alloacidobacterium sp.]|jgi:hypothetical protein
MTPISGVKALRFVQLWLRVLDDDFKMVNGQLTRYINDMDILELVNIIDWNKVGMEAQ